MKLFTTFENVLSTQLFIQFRHMHTNSPWLLWGSIVIVVVSALVFDVATLFSFPVFFIGECGFGGSPGGSTPGGGDTDGGAGGDSASDCCVGNCGCSTSGCAPGSCTCGADGGGGIYTSTPYLYLQDSKKQWVMQNDVMIGYPMTLQSDEKSGRAAFAAGALGHDQYLLPSNLISKTSPILNLQIREIEPEESYINSFQLLAYQLPATHALVNRWDHAGFMSFDPKAIFTHHADIRHSNGQMCTEILKSNNKNSTTLEGGASLRITAVVPSAEALYLQLRSVFRDWTPGYVEQTENQVQLSPYPVKRRSLKALSAGISATLATLLFAVGVPLPQSKSAESGALAFAQSCGLVKSAHADVGSHNSLLVHYFDTVRGLFVHCATIQPRAHNATDVLLAIPAEARRKDGTVVLEILATKLHIVEEVTLFSGEVVEEVVPAASILPTKITHHSYEGTMDDVAHPQNNLASFIHLKPSERLSVDFELPVAPAGVDQQLALKLAGFYTPLSNEAAALIGDWQDRLEPLEQALIKEKYPLQGYSVRKV